MIYVLAYPAFDDVVSAFIARLRLLHEPERAKLVAPHITLVFGLRNQDPVVFIPFCERVISGTDEIVVDFTSTEIVRDAFENTYKMFLMASAGKAQLTSLHQKLYDGPQRNELHTDIPFRPHMTVASNERRSKIEGLGAILAPNFPINARVSEVEIVELTENGLHSLKKMRLKA